MRQMLVAMLMVLAGAGLAAAGDEPGGADTPAPGRGERIRQFIIERVTRELNLTPEQVEAMKGLEPLFRQRLQEAQGDREKMREAFDWLQTEVRNNLTPEQRERLDSGVERLRQGIQSLATFSTPGRLDAALQGLGLDDITRRAIEQLRKERDRQIEEAVKAFQDSVLPLLTAEQREQVRKALEASLPAGPPAGGPPGAPRSGAVPGSPPAAERPDEGDAP